MKPKFSILTLLGITLFCISSIFFGLKHLLDQQRLEHERRGAELRQSSFDRVKDGNSRPLVTDSKLLPMLANDNDCKIHVTHLDFASTDIDAADAKYVAELQNVRSMMFYCTRGTNEVLKAARTLPITHISFELPDLSHESYLILKDFRQLKSVHFEQVMDDEWIDRLKSELPDVTIDAPHRRSKEARMTK